MSVASCRRCSKRQYTRQSSVLIAVDLQTFTNVDVNWMAVGLLIVKQSYSVLSEDAFNLGADRAAAVKTPPERRQSIRFPIECEVRYKVLNTRGDRVSGCGKTVNISSSGVLFFSEHDLPTGTRLEVSIGWPVLLNEKCSLNLVIQGRVIRRMTNQTAVQIQHYEFRTHARTGPGSDILGAER